MELDQLGKTVDFLIIIFMIELLHYPKYTHCLLHGILI